MTLQHEVQCPKCQQMFRDEDAMRQHSDAEHHEPAHHEPGPARHQPPPSTQQHADQPVDRQQDAAGRRESAGQPGGDAQGEGNQGRNLRQMNAAQPGEDIGQQTQQQQPQTHESERAR